MGTRVLTINVLSINVKNVIFLLLLLLLLLLLFLLLKKFSVYCMCNVQPNQATETPSVEKHAHPPRVVYCAIYLTLTLITKFRVSYLHITTH